MCKKGRRVLGGDDDRRGQPEAVDMGIVGESSAVVGLVGHASLGRAEGLPDRGLPNCCGESSPERTHVCRSMFCESNDGATSGATVPSL